MIVFIVASAPTESNMLTAARGSGGEKDVSASTTYELQEYLIWGSVLGLTGPRVNILVDCRRDRGFVSAAFECLNEIKGSVYFFFLKHT